MSKKSWFHMAARRASKQARPKYIAGSIVDRLKRAAKAEGLAPVRRLANRRRWFEHPVRRQS